MTLMSMGRVKSTLKTPWRLVLCIAPLSVAQIKQRYQWQLAMWSTTQDTYLSVTCITMSNVLIRTASFHLFFFQYPKVSHYVAQVTKSSTNQGYPDDRKDNKDPEFRTFKKQLFHQALSAVFSSLKPAMSKPVIRRCPDSQFRRVIYDFAAFIGDYPEQVVLAGIVQGWCAK